MIRVTGCEIAKAIIGQHDLLCCGTCHYEMSHGHDAYEEITIGNDVYPVCCTVAVACWKWEKERDKRMRG